MATFRRHINTSLLPDDIFSYTDTQFYEVVKRIVVEGAAELLEIQSIRSPDSLLQIPDVFAILDIKCAALNSLKEKICLKSDDDLYLVKPGIKSLMNYFYELIIKKQDENIKSLEKKRRLHNSITSSNNVDLSDTNGTSTDQQPQQSSSSTATKIVQSSSTAAVNENYHRNFILKSIENWCERYFSSRISLSEGTDYHLYLTPSSERNFTAKIKCNCGSKISLVKVRKNFQLSNFYKHLVSITCTTIKNSKKKSVSNKNASKKTATNVNKDTTPEGIFF